MQTITEHIRARLLRDLEPPTIIPYEVMRDTQWSTRFEQYMRNRMIMGGYRYGRIDDNTGPKFDSVGSAIERARLYLRDGNQEHLVDIANLALVEFIRGCCHPNPHWSPIDDGYHTEELRNERAT